MMRLFRFNSLITTSIIKFLFYLGIAGSVVGALGKINSGIAIMTFQAWLGFTYILGGLFLILLGVIGSRVCAEMILVLFMIRDELAWQRQQSHGIRTE